MAKKRTTESKRRRKSSASSLKKTLEAAITSNPFLNFFLSKCRVKGNAKLHKFAKKAGDQWKDMSYQEKTPYYLLADKARAPNVRKKNKKRRFSESDIGEGSFSMITVIKKPETTKKNSEEEIDNQTDKTHQETKKTVPNQEQNQEGKPPDKPPTQTSVKTEETAMKKHHKPCKRKQSHSSRSTGSTSFHSMDSDDSVERISKRRQKKTKSWTDSFDYMS